QFAVRASPDVSQNTRAGSSAFAILLQGFTLPARRCALSITGARDRSRNSGILPSLGELPRLTASAVIDRASHAFTTRRSRMSENDYLAQVMAKQQRVEVDLKARRASPAAKLMALAYAEPQPLEPGALRARTAVSAAPAPPPEPAAAIDAPAV